MHSRRRSQLTADNGCSQGGRNISAGLISAGLIGAVLLSACASGLQDPALDGNPGLAGLTDEQCQPVDPSHFIRAALLEEIRIEQRELADGTVAACYVITTKSEPIEHAMGPWSPRHITDGPEKAGVWMHNGELHDVDGPFVQNAPKFFQDPEWNLVREDGSVRYTDTREAFEAAARPDVDPRYQNHVVEGDPSWYTDRFLTTYVIPVQPRFARQQIQTPHASVGVAFNGVKFDPPAPVQAILDAHTLAPLDDGGGHLNPFAGYHYHAATGHTKTVEQSDGHAPMIGYAMDGFGIFAQLDKQGQPAEALDEYGGHTDEVRGYHYHVGTPGSNRILRTLRGVPGTISMPNAPAIPEPVAPPDGREHQHPHPHPHSHDPAPQTGRPSASLKPKPRRANKSARSGLHLPAILLY